MNKFLIYNTFNLCRPKEFDDVKDGQEEEKPTPITRDRGDEETSSEDDLPANPNRPNVDVETESEEEDSSDADSQDDEDDKTVMSN